MDTDCIRPARVEDAARMGAVFVETYHAAHRGQVPDVLIQSRTPQQSARGWQRALCELAASADPDWCIYVAQDEREQVVGIVVGRPARSPNDVCDAPVATDVPDACVPDHAEAAGRPGDGEVSLLYVLPARQGRGHGRRLVQAVARFLANRGARRMKIGVLAVNAPARGFYERIGGQLVGYRPYEEDGHVMEEAVYAWDLDQPGHRAPAMTQAPLSVLSALVPPPFALASVASATAIAILRSVYTREQLGARPDS